MKIFLIAVAAVAVFVTVPAFAADVGISLNIGQPGFYGRLDLGDYPQPQVIYRQPIAIEQVPLERTPIYLRVPPGHAKHWRKYCHEYNACGERVFFVQDNWYSHEYVPRYQEQHRDRLDERRDEQRDDRRDERRDDRHDNRRDDRRDDNRDRDR